MCGTSSYQHSAPPSTIDFHLGGDPGSLPTAGECRKARTPGLTVELRPFYGLAHCHVASSN